MKRWPGVRFHGNEACLNWSLRDLDNLEAAVKFVPERRVVVQAGGNVGIFPRRLAELFETVHTFEPDPTLFGYLRSNAPFKNIHAVCAALGDDVEPVSLCSDRRDNSGRLSHPGLTHVVPGGGDVRQMRLDELQLTRCDLLYLDIEGYELRALRGAEETIARCRPVIVVEINRSITYYGITDEFLRAWIRERGYQRVLRVNSDEVFVACR